MSRARVVRILAAGAFGVGMVVGLSAAGRRCSRRLVRSLGRTARYQSGRLEGLRYRMAGRQPDPDADDNVLADRVRSVLGPLERRLDMPRIHVQVYAHEVLLHGDVASDADATRIVDATKAIPGVRRVRSHLHVGFFPGDTRPSEGAKHHAESAALCSVLAAAHGAGVRRGSERAAARSVLSTFASLLPPGERRHVLSHLPADLRELAGPPRPRWIGHRSVRRVDDFALAALPTYDPSSREAIVESVIGAVRELVPEEAADVASVLPGELRHLWKTAIPA